MRAIAIMLAVVFVSACNPGHGQMLQTARESTRGEAQRNVGETRWIKTGRSVPVCPAPRPIGAPPGADCTTLQAGRSFTITGFELDPQHALAHYRVRAGTVEGFIAWGDYANAEPDETRSKRVAADAACDRKGGVRIGMTKREALASCWGKPDRINSTLTGRNRHEQWVYGDSYLYFDNDSLSSIQTSEKPKP